MGVLAWRFKNLRECKGVSLRQVEEATNISNAYLSQIENGHNVSPSIWMVKRLAEYYEVGLDYLVAPFEQEKDFEENFSYTIKK